MQMISCILNRGTTVACLRVKTNVEKYNGPVDMHNDKIDFKTDTSLKHSNTTVKVKNVKIRRKKQKYFYYYFLIEPSKVFFGHISDRTSCECRGKRIGGACW